MNDHYVESTHYFIDEKLYYFAFTICTVLLYKIETLVTLHLF